jgi:hypothetical protein
MHELQQIGDPLIYIAGLIMSIWGVLGIIQKVLDILKKPNDTQNERIKGLESRVEKLEVQNIKFLEFFDHDKKRIDSIVEGNAATQNVILQISNHLLYGNNTEEMKEACKHLQKYLTSRVII